MSPGVPHTGYKYLNLFDLLEIIKILITLP